MFKKACCIVIVLLLVVACSIAAYAWGESEGLAYGPYKGTSTLAYNGGGSSLKPVNAPSSKSFGQSSVFTVERVASINSLNEKYSRNYDNRVSSAIETGYVDALKSVITQDQSAEGRIAAIQGLGIIFDGEGDAAGNCEVKSLLLDNVLTDGYSLNGAESPRVDYTTEDQVAAATAIGDMFHGLHDARAVEVCKKLVTHGNNSVDLEVKAELIKSIGTMYASPNGYENAQYENIPAFLDAEQSKYKNDLKEAEFKLDRLDSPKSRIAKALDSSSNSAVEEQQKLVDNLKVVVNAFDSAGLNIHEWQDGYDR
jgi:hypothetical protein